MLLQLYAHKHDITCNTCGKRGVIGYIWEESSIEPLKPIYGPISKYQPSVCSEECFKLLAAFNLLMGD